MLILMGCQNKIISSSYTHVLGDPSNLFFIGKNDTEFKYIKDKNLKTVSSRYDKGGYFNNGLAIICKNEKYGVINDKYEEIIKPQFDYINTFNEGVSQFKLDDKWGLIDSYGNIILEPKYDSISCAKEGFCIIKSYENKNNCKYGYIKIDGNILVNPEFDYCKDFSEGLAAVEKDGKYGYIDKYGTLVIDYKFEDAKNFSEEVAVAKLNDENIVINKQGDILFNIDKKYKAGDSFKGGHLPISVELNIFWGHSYGFINKKGTVVVEPQFSNVMSFKNDIAIVEKNSTRSYLLKRE